MSEKNKIYTTADFERYYSGAMPVNEMHELERAALEDPFLADALEGYTYSSSFENDVAELKERLKEKKRKKSVITISSFTRSGWWRIAALFIIIGVAGYFFYRMNYKSKENSIAKKELTPIVQHKEATRNTDTSAITNDVAFENQAISRDEENKKNTLSALKPTIQKQINTGSKSIKIPPSPSAERSSHQEFDSVQFNMTTASNDSKALPKYSLKGKVTNENGKPLVFAMIENKNEIAVTDTTGRFLLASTDSNANATVSASGYSSKKVALQKDKESVIAMNENSASLDEVVVSGYGQTKKSKMTSESKQLNGNVSGIEITTQEIASSANSDKFDEYMKENLQPVYDENNNRLTGDVLLSFTINKKGRPRNIKVVKSSCKKCETEAMTLLENGPGWIVEKSKQKTVLVKF
jgi:CarboxypepD_reg-like domain/Gram-negative bacterial TonB protein C-terminal